MKILRGNKFVCLFSAALLSAALGGLLWKGAPAPLSLHAAEASQHTWTHDGGEEGVQELNEQTSELTAGTNYYLTKDVTNTNMLSVEGGAVEICLNGYRLTLSGGSISVYEGGTLKLWDCGLGECSEHTDTAAHKGEITGATESVITAYIGSFEMNGGTIKDNSLEYGGGVVSVQAGGSFTMNGGTISGNTAAESGGGVYVKDGTFTMTGGSISGNTANGSTQTEPFAPAGGGGVYVEHGTVSISGGTISGNTAANGYGGGILLNATQEYRDVNQQLDTPSINFTLSGEALIANNTAKSGGGVAALGGVTATMTDGIIGGKASADQTTVNGNTATDENNNAGGGGVYLLGTTLTYGDEPQTTAELYPTFTLSGGTIGYEAEEGWTVDSSAELRNSGYFGGGVYVGENSAFTLTENGVIGFDISAEQYEAGNADETQKYPYGNVCTQGYNAGGDGVCVIGSTFSMTGGKVVYSGTNGIYVGDKYGQTSCIAEVSGGVIAYNNNGVQAGMNGTLKLSGNAALSDNGNGIYAYEGGTIEMTGGTVKNNFTGIWMQSSMLGISSVAIGGGTITGNETGVQFGGNLSLAGEPVIKDNTDTESGHPSNLVINDGATIDISGLTGGEIYVTAAGRQPFTTGYQAGMEAYIHYDGYDQQGLEDPDAKITPVSDGYGSTELALTYHITFKDRDSELQFPELSGDYIADTDIKELFCDYNYDEGSYSLREEVIALLVKDPDETNHYTFLQFLDEEGTPYDFSNGYYRLEKNITIQVAFTAEEHDFGAWSKVDGETHSHLCATCQYVATADHTWSDWTDNQNGTHSRECSDGCGAKETAVHTWGPWTKETDGADGTHVRRCTEETCTATDTQTHQWGPWSPDEDGLHHSRTCQIDGCGATDQAEHNFPDTWSYQNGTNHIHVCDDCGESESMSHSWSDWTDDGEGTHSRTCNDGCGAKETAVHTWGPWSDKGDGNHERTCTEASCGATDTQAHQWGPWSPDEDGLHHSRTCRIDGCVATDQAEHAFPDTWMYQDDATHIHVCDDCGQLQTAQHSWGIWTDNQDGTHSRECSDNCGAKETAVHTWSEWTDAEGETLTRDCGDCSAHEVKANEQPVLAALSREGTFNPYYTLQDAFDAAEADETVYLVLLDGGTELASTLTIPKSVALGAVTRTVDEQFRAVYQVTAESVRLKRAPSLTGAMISIAAGARVEFTSLIIEGGESETPAVEVYGALTVSGGEIDATCAIRVCAPNAQGIALYALGDDASLKVTGTPNLIGTIRLDDPDGSTVPCVDFEGFTGTATVEISDTRPYGAFATGLEEGASLTVQGGRREQNGLSCREVRTENGMALCGGYDLTVEQNALGEVTLGGSCDEYRTSLSVTVNGQELMLDAVGGSFTAQNVDTGSENLANISVGGSEVSYGVVSFDGTTGLLIAPAGATYSIGGEEHALDDADPFAFALGGDSATVTVGGTARTLDFSRPVGTAFFYRYLSDEGVPYDEIDFNNYNKIKEGESIYAEMTNGQKNVVSGKLTGTPYSSFDELLQGADAYLAAQNQKREEFLNGNDVLSKEFGDVNAADRDALGDALDAYRDADADEKYFLDEMARQQEYSGFEGLLEDLLAKSDFEDEKDRTLEDLDSILRGCDGEEVHRELDLTIEKVEAAVYEGCTEDDLRLEYLAGRKDALDAAVRALENIRIKERAKSAIEAYLLEKRQSGCYSEEALAEMEKIAEAATNELMQRPQESLEDGQALEELLSEELRRLNDVRAETVVSGDEKPEELDSAIYPEHTEKWLGYLTKAEGFRGDSSLALLPRSTDDAREAGFVALLGVTVRLTGDEMDGTVKVCLLLPEDARDFAGYRVMSVASGGAQRNARMRALSAAQTEVGLRDARLEGNMLVFETYGDTDFIIFAQKKIELSWLIVLLGCLCGLETAALLYVAGYLMKNRTAAFAPFLLGAVIVPASAGHVCIALGAICLVEAVALVLLVMLIRRREKNREAALRGKKTL